MFLHEDAAFPRFSLNVHGSVVKHLGIRRHCVEKCGLLFSPHLFYLNTSGHKCINTIKWVWIELPVDQTLSAFRECYARFPLFKTSIICIPFRSLWSHVSASANSARVCSTNTAAFASNETRVHASLHRVKWARNYARLNSRRGFHPFCASCVGFGAWLFWVIEGLIFISCFFFLFFFSSTS